ncbi:MAG: hypothetical protein MPW15_05730 [Candidatus Manganitrophus sp.]|nr:hypothetical protein [Candidatus Manganitrophus sp.]
MPVKLGQGGIEEIIQIQLTPEEEANFRRSATAVRELCEAVDKMI